MTPEEMQRFLESRLNYEKRGMPAQQELRIDRVVALLDRIGSPQRSFPIVHIAGSKGKGSTAHMVASMIQSTRAAVGLHTSPHLERLEERFRINGACATPSTLAMLMGELVPHIASVDDRLIPTQPELTFFEITTALFLLYFQRSQVDWAVVEVGMGGRLDSTNVVDPRVSVITSISRDHTRQLGNTLEKIAAEKAGIIKPGRPVVIGQVTAPVGEVIEQIAQRNSSQTFVLGRDYQFRYEPRGFGGLAWVETWRGPWPVIELNMLGAHQAHNAAVAVATIDVLRDAGLDVDLQAAAKELANVQLPGRIEIIATDPLVVLDVAHNDASAEALESTLRTLQKSTRSFPGPKIFLSYGTSADKEWAKILTLLAKDYDHVVLTSYLTNPRAVPANELARQMPAQLQDKLVVTTDPLEAWQAVTGLLQPGSPSGTPGTGVVCITGSFYLAAEFRELLKVTAQKTNRLEPLRH